MHATDMGLTNETDIKLSQYILSLFTPLAGNAMDIVRCFVLQFRNNHDHSFDAGDKILRRDIMPL